MRRSGERAMPVPDGLAFTLYAPFAALGDLAVGERRGGFDRPARSAILGLVGAALGLDRADEAGHARLDRGYRLAQRVRLGGTLVTDYHTVQAPPADRKAAHATRRDALDRPSHRLNTLLSSRDYRADLWVDVALVRVETDAPAPAVLAQALRRPVYTLYLGRKSCPLGRPPAPRCAEAVDRLAPLLDTPLPPATEGGSDPFAPLALMRRSAEARLYADADLAPLLAPDFRIDRVERRRDRVASRLRRHFTLRDEIVASPAGPSPEREPAS
ncbi:MAG: type I-E CRISPR-associated protein Cas5/CasD [Methylobacterium frigidaeris]